MKKRKHIYQAFSIFALLVISFALPATGIAGEPQPGDVIDATNVEQYADYFPYFVQRFIKDGWGISKPNVVHVREYEPCPPPKSYRDATERNKGKAKLDPSGGWLTGWEAGCPFPDPKEPNKALKIMWNINYRWRSDSYIYPDNFASYRCRKGGKVTSGESEVRYLFFKGRTVLEPKPIIPNNHNLYFTLLTSLLTPPSKGMKILTWRYDDERNDDMWTYIPTLRRTLRMVSSERQNPVSGSAVTWDDFYGFEGKISQYTATFVGDRKFLFLNHQKTLAEGEYISSYPHPMCDGPADPWELVDFWEIDVVHKNPRSPEKKKTLWVKKDDYHIPYAQIYDRNGKLWKGNEYQDMPIKTLDGDWGPFQTEMSMTDFKTGFWSGCLLRHVNMNQAMNPVEFQVGDFYNYGP